MTETYPEYLVYLRHLEKKYQKPGEAYGSVIRATKEEKQKLQSLVPCSDIEDKLVDDEYFAEIIEDAKRLFNSYGIKIFLRLNAVNNQVVKEAIYDFPARQKEIEKALGFNINHHSLGQTRWRLNRLEKVCYVLDIDPHEIVKPNAILDEDIIFPLTGWINYPKLKLRAENAPLTLFKDLYGFNLTYKVTGKSRINLKQLKQIGRPEKYLYPSAYQRLEEMLDGYRTIGEDVGFESSRFRGHRKRVRV